MSTNTNTVSSLQKEQKEYNTFRFVDYRVYHESKKWLQEVFSLKGIFETNTDVWYQLKSNMTALVMNIAAASTKLPGDAKRYLGNSITAANKSVACLDIACDLQVIRPEEFEAVSAGLKGVIIQLKCLIRAMGTKKADETASANETVEQTA